MKITIGKCKDNLFVILPKEVVARLGWQHGDVLNAELADGEMKIVRTMTAHDRMMEIAERAIQEYRETFETLAKL